MKFWTQKVNTPEDRVALLEKVVEKSAFTEQGVGLRQLVIRDMLAQARDRDDLGQAQAIYNWVKGNVRYIEDQVALDFFPTAQVVLSLGGGDCDCHTVLICAAAASVGFMVGCRVIQTREGEWHIYPLVFLPKNAPKQPLPMDTTWPGAKSAGDEYPAKECYYRKSWVFDFGGV